MLLTRSASIKGTVFSSVISVILRTWLLSTRRNWWPCSCLWVGRGPRGISCLENCRLISASLGGPTMDSKLGSMRCRSKTKCYRTPKTALSLKSKSYRTHCERVRWRRPNREAKDTINSQMYRTDMIVISAVLVGVGWTWGWTCSGNCRNWLKSWWRSWSMRDTWRRRWVSRSSSCRGMFWSRRRRLVWRIARYMLWRLVPSRGVKIEIKAGTTMARAIKDWLMGMVARLKDWAMDQAVKCKDWIMDQVVKHKDWATAKVKDSPIPKAIKEAKTARISAWVKARLRSATSSAESRSVAAKRIARLQTATPQNPSNSPSCTPLLYI